MKTTITIIYPAYRTFMYDIETDIDHDDILSDVFGDWNAGSGSECELFLSERTRSMGVGDVVGIDGHWYLCMPIGWKKISIMEVIRLEKDVETHPLYKEGAWFALQRVLDESDMMVET